MAAANRCRQIVNSNILLTLTRDLMSFPSSEGHYFNIYDYGLGSVTCLEIFFLHSSMSFPFYRKGAVPLSHRAASSLRPSSDPEGFFPIFPLLSIFLFFFKTKQIQ